VVAVAAATTAVLVTSVLSSAQAVRAGWGDTRPVAVVRRAVDAGARLAPGDVEVVDWPDALVPSDALSHLPDRAIARVALADGEPLLATRLVRGGAGRVAATLPSGTRAVAVPTAPGTAPPVEVGDRVDVLVAVAPDAAGGGPPGFAVATDALVVAVADDAVTVAVERSEAPRVAAALGMGAVTLALVGA
jgi:Flp pilus assembly protein CpaB